MQLADATRHLNGVDAKEVVPFRLPRAFPYAVACLVAAVVLLAWPRENDEVVASTQEANPGIVAVADKILEDLKELEKAAEEQQSEELKTLVNELRARVPLVHADLYRLGQPDELIELGLADRVGRDAIVLVEWGDRFAEALGGEGLWIFLSLTAEGRAARLEVRGARGRDILERLRAHAPELAGAT